MIILVIETMSESKSNLGVIDNPRDLKHDFALKQSTSIFKSIVMQLLKIKSNSLPLPPIFSVGDSIICVKSNITVNINRKIINPIEDAGEGPLPVFPLLLLQTYELALKNLFFSFNFFVTLL